MHVERFSSPTQFASRVVPFLSFEEARNTLQLGLCAQLTSADSVYENPYMACVVNGDEVVSVALMTPPFPLTVGYLSERSARLIVEDLEGSQWTTKGVNGHKNSAELFAAVWAPARKLRSNTIFNQRIYELTKVVEAPPVPGQLDVCSSSDLDQVREWWIAFSEEAHLGGPHVGREKSLQRLGQKLKAEEVFFWRVADKPVTLIGVAGDSSHGARIGPVYTPPSQRRQGFGTAATAALSQRLLDGGKSFCCLYTDLANPTSNGIYQKIGYRPVADALQLEFVEA